MMQGNQNERHPRLIQGGSGTLRLGDIPVIAAPVETPPFAVDGQVYEEDRFLVMAAPPEFKLPTEHPLRIIDQAWKQEPLPVGTVLSQPGKLYRYIAVVHDLDLEPSCRASWVLAALEALREKLLADTAVRSLATPLLGVRYGPLSIVESLSILQQAMDGERWTLDRLWLQVCASEFSVVQAFLEGGNR